MSSHSMVIVHRVKPEYMAQYLEESARFVELMDEKQTGAKLAGSWTCMIGDQDEAVHLWKYKGGYSEYNKATAIYRTDPVSFQNLLLLETVC